MLSETNTVSDIKTRLINPYSFYELDSNVDYTNRLVAAVEDVRILDMEPIIGETLYAVIAGYDKIGLSSDHNKIYWAEIYKAMARFVLAIDAGRMQGVMGSSYNHSVDDVSESISGAGDSGLRVASSRYAKIAREYLSAAGYFPTQLSRGGVPA